LWRVRNSRGRPKNAPAAFIHPCRPTVAKQPPRRDITNAPQLGPILIRRGPKPSDASIDESSAPPPSPVYSPGLILNSSGPLLSAAQILGRLEWAELSSSRTKATRDTCEGKRANSQSRRMMWGAPSLQTGVNAPRRRSRAVKVTGAIDVDRDCSGARLQRSIKHDTNRRRS
jgi:hypothetical protein